MKNFNTRHISDYQPHFLNHESILNETVEKSHYEKLYSLELEMKLLEEKMGESEGNVVTIYNNLTTFIYKKFEIIDMLFTRLDFVDKREGHNVLEDIDDKLVQLEEKIATLKSFFTEH
jgi:hypothetical protein